MPPVMGAMAGGIAAPKAKGISADSFRRLTSLLKKEAPVPTLSPAPSFIAPALPVAPVYQQPAPIIEAYVAPLPLEIKPEPLPEFIVPELIVPEIIISEPVVIAPVLISTTAEIRQPESLEFAIVPELSTPIAEPKPIAPQPKLRDVFAQSPAAMPTRAAIVPVPQTPEQDLANAELARSLLDMMASSNSSGLPQERALAADTLLRMLPRLPLKSLIMLSERLCMMEQPPQLIVAKLIADPRIEVSGPLLEDCSHITDEVLVSVINEAMPDKRRMLARRRNISRAVSTSLIATEEPSVLLTLARNMGAEIAHEGFIEFVRLAANHPDLLAPLCTRPDLPVPYAFELFWISPAQLRRYLLSRFLTDSETLTKILKITLDDQVDKTVFPDPEDVIASLHLASEGKIDEAAERLAHCAKIDAATAIRVLEDQQGDSLAALLKAVGVPRNTAAEILTHAVTTILDSTRDPEELQSLFDSLSFNKARILLTYWDWASLQTGPYAPLN